MDQQKADAIMRRVEAMTARVADTKKVDLYYYNQPISEIYGWSESFGKWACHGDVCFLQLSRLSWSSAD